MDTDLIYSTLTYPPTNSINQFHRPTNQLSQSISQPTLTPNRPTVSNGQPQQTIMFNCISSLSPFLNHHCERLVHLYLLSFSILNRVYLSNPSSISLSIFHTYSYSHTDTLSDTHMHTRTFSLFPIFIYPYSPTLNNTLYVNLYSYSDRS